ncbi:MAG: hypothetical protein GW789_01955 [Ignavibacteria bacterium]|nr:hypothetical protein [Ignavibacteria bacterium]
MKKIFFMFCLIYSVLFGQEQNRFLIGADWLNPHYPHPNSYYNPLSEAYWDTVKSLGLNYGALHLGSDFYCGHYHLLHPG